MSVPKLFLLSCYVVCLAGCSSLGNWVGSQMANAMIGPDSNSCTQEDIKRSKSEDNPADKRCAGKNVGNPLGGEWPQAQDKYQKRKELGGYPRFEPPAWAVFPTASTDVRGVLGGKGEGQNCSVPWLLKLVLFEDPNKAAKDTNEKPKEAPSDVKQRRLVSDLELRFRQSCVMHDMCYRHGNATYGYTQRDCDQMVFDSQVRICSDIFRRDFEPCRTEAGLVLVGLKLGGFSAFKGDGESTFFEYDPMARPRYGSFTVARALQPGSSNPAVVVYGFEQKNNTEHEKDAVWVATVGGKPEQLSGVARSDLLPPPTIVSIDGQEKHFWLKRARTGDTELRAYSSDPGKANLTPFSFANSQNTNATTTLECDTPLLHVVNSPNIKLLNYGQRALQLESGKLSCEKSFRLSGKTIDQIWTLPDVIIENRYRLQQLPPIQGSFSAPNKNELLFFARGYYPWNGQSGGRTHSQERKDSDAGKEYQQLTAILSRDLEKLHEKPNNNPPTSHTVANISEKQEPLVAFKPKGNGVDTLVGLQEKSLCQWHYLASTWRAEQCVPLSRFLPSGSSWLDVPPQVIRGRSNDEGDTLVFMRACVKNCTRWMAWSWMPDFPLLAGSEVVLEYRAIKQKGSGLENWYATDGGAETLSLSDFVKTLNDANKEAPINETLAALSIRRGQWLVHRNPEVTAQSALAVSVVPRPKPGFVGHMPPFQFAAQTIFVHAK